MKAGATRSIGQPDLRRGGHPFSRAEGCGHAPVGDASARVRVGGVALGQAFNLNLPKKRATLRPICMVEEAMVIDGEACVPAPARA